MNVRSQSRPRPHALLLTVLLLIAAQTVVAAHLHDEALPDASCVVCSSGHADKVDAGACITVHVPQAAGTPPAAAVPARRATTAIEVTRARGPPAA